MECDLGARRAPLAPVRRERRPFPDAIGRQNGRALDRGREKGCRRMGLVVAREEDLLARHRQMRRNHPARHIFSPRQLLHGAWETPPDRGNSRSALVRIRSN